MARAFGVRVATFLLFLFAAGTIACAQSARDTAVEVSAVVQESPPQITLNWLPSTFTVTLQKVYRRLKGAPIWGELATPANEAISYVDTAVSPGVSYEYFVYRAFAGPHPAVAAGYLNAGIGIPAVEERGKAILLVDDTMAVPLATELSRFEQDLAGDGWVVLRQEVSRTATVPAVKAMIQAIYALDPVKTRALILFGRIAVPYSGNFMPDGHTDHAGAWPADVYYGDMNGVWTDFAADNDDATRVENQNVPGDGKFDPSVLPSDVELEVGRIDLSSMNVPSATETDLLRQYLNRNHDFRHRAGNFANVVRRGLIDDDYFGYAGGEAFSATGWRNFTVFFGSTPGSVVAGDWLSTLPTQSHLWAYGCGPGGYNHAGFVATSSDFATTPSLAVFNILFGSYHGDWDYPDAFLRAPLAGPPGSLGLVCLWAGRPHWHLHHMALGETVGYGARLSQNNFGTFTAGYLLNNFGRGVHIALMGDPTLRLHPVLPVTNLTANSGSGVPVLAWTASADAAIQGYTVHRAASPAGPFQRIGNSLVTGLTYTDRTGTPGQSYTYMVRAVKLEASASGTYYNKAQGVLVGGSVPGPVPREINLTSNGQVIPSGDTDVAVANGTDFGQAEINLGVVVHTFTIANDGTSPLHLSGTPRVQVTGPPEGDFTVETLPPSEIAGGGSANFQIKFAPEVIGVRSAIITIASDDPDEGSYTFILRGLGLPETPEIALAPGAIVRTLAPGASDAVPLTIDNSGPVPLHHTVTTSQSVYSFRDSASFGGPSYSWIEIAATGTEVTGFGNPDDGISAPIAIGFGFPFYGNVFTTLRVCTNGFISFTDQSAAFGNTSLPSAGAPSNLIAAYWDDLILDGSSKIYTQQIGGMFVIQFDDVQVFNTQTQRLTFQIVLKPGGEILLQYQSVTGPDYDYTVGIQNAARTAAVEIAHNTNYAQSGLAVRIAPPGFDTWLKLNASGGTVAPSGSQLVEATLDATGLAPGAYHATISVASDDADEPLLIIPVNLTVPTPIELWRLAYFGTIANAGAAANSADPDFDGATNLREYGFTIDPLSNGAAGLPVVSVNTGGYLQIEFTRNTTRTDLTYEVEAGTDLIGWTMIAKSVAGGATVPFGAHSVGESGVGPVKTVVVEDSALASAQPRRFLRVHLKQP